MKILISDSESLQTAIEQLEENQLIQKQQLLTNYKLKMEGYKPNHVIKTVVTNISSGSALKKTILVAGSGIATVFLFRKLLFKKAVKAPFGILSFLGNTPIASLVTNLIKRKAR